MEVGVLRVGVPTEGCDTLHAKAERNILRTRPERRCAIRGAIVLAS